MNRALFWYLWTSKITATSFSTICSSTDTRVCRFTVVRTRWTEIILCKNSRQVRRFGEFVNRACSLTCWWSTGIKTVMIATSVAGRGLDVPEIVCVINYNCPNHLEDYVHRVGRTGRAGRKGTAYTFISPEEQQYAHIMLRALEKAHQIQQESLASANPDTHIPEPFNPPQELVALSDEFKAKVERGEAHYHSAQAGFVGQKGSCSQAFIYLHMKHPDYFYCM
jgi:hypothetical protein